VRTLIAGAALVMVAACGGGSDDSGDGEAGGAPEAPRVYDEADLIDHLDAKGSMDSYVNFDGTRCEVAVYLTSAGMVSLYADAGDVVATNPTRTAGVKVVSDNQATCHELFTEALADLP